MTHEEHTRWVRQSLLADDMRETHRGVYPKRKPVPPVVKPVPVPPVREPRGGERWDHGWSAW